MQIPYARVWSRRQKNGPIFGKLIRKNTTRFVKAEHHPPARPAVAPYHCCVIALLVRCVPA